MESCAVILTLLELNIDDNSFSMYNINEKKMQTMLHHKQNILAEKGLLLISHHYFAIRVNFLFSSKKCVIGTQQIYIIKNELSNKMNMS